MRSRLLHALAVGAWLGGQPTDGAKGITGKNAVSVSPEDACRIGGRIRRAVQHRRDAMSVAQLVRWSTQRRRARQTHPGKRGNP